MFRLLTALSIALGCHLLLLLLPWPQASTPPQPTSKNGIEVYLQKEQVSPATPPSEAVQPIPKAVVSKLPSPIHINKAIQSKKIVTIIKRPTSPPPPTPAQNPQVAQNSSSDNEEIRPAIIQAVALYQQNQKPEYPSLARRRNWQGTVILSIIVSVTGKGKSIRVHSSSGHNILDKSALQTVQSWYFLPGTEGGIPIEMQVLVPVHFRLDG